MSGKLSPFSFEFEKDGETTSFTWYAISRLAALRMAKTWASSRGYTIRA